MSGVLDRIAGSALLSKLPAGGLIQQPIQNIAIGIGAKRALNAPASIAGAASDAANLQAQRRLGLMPAALLGVMSDAQSQDEKKKLSDFGR